MSPQINNRLYAIDILRGLTIAAMILTNNPGSSKEGARFAALIHSQWHGCTPADLIFPFFVFLSGVSLAWSLGKRREKESSLLPVYHHILRRTCSLFFLGLFGWFACGWLFQAICPPAVTDEGLWAILWHSPGDTEAYFYSLDNLRLPGVLQRLALVYLGVAILIIHTGWRLQSLFLVMGLFLYWGLMSLPGFPLEPGADFGSWLDRALWGEAHLYQQSWDPEGLLGTLPATASGLIGALTGQWLKSAREYRWKLAGLFLFGLSGILLGWLWSFIFPLNKNLWTSSFVLYTSGWAMAILGVLYWLFDGRKIRPWGFNPVLRLGQNALSAYVLSQIGFMALTMLYLGTPSEHTSLLALLADILFGRHWDVMGLSPWPDPRWPSLLWAVLCLIPWTLLIALKPGRLKIPAVAAVQQVCKYLAASTLNKSWDARRTA